MMAFQPFFYQSYWYIIEDDITNFFLQVLNKEIQMVEINFIKIILSPKIESANEMSLFQPISLLSILYKIIFKALVNRLKLILDSYIGEAQRAFVLGRLILDNVVVGYELMHALKKKRLGKKGSFALKLDMSKAYN